MARCLWILRRASANKWHAAYRRMPLTHSPDGARRIEFGDFLLSRPPAEPTHGDGPLLQCGEPECLLQLHLVYRRGDESTQPQVGGTEIQRLRQMPYIQHQRPI